MRFCEILQSIQNTRGYNSAIISEFTGIPQDTVYSHMVGRRFPTRNTFIIYNRFFHFVESDDIWTVTDAYYKFKNLE